MDPLTHALASYTLKRAAFPRAARSVTAAILVAGTIPDLDNLSAYFGPSAFLTFYRTAFHSLAAAVVVPAIAALVFLALNHRSAEKRIAFRTLLVATLTASLTHVLLDLTQSDSVELLWPFSSRRFALDLTAHLDLWIAGIFLAALLIPKLSSLVTEEIGVKSKGPRGKVGATVALATVILYTALRAALHANAIADIESRSYRGESRRRVAALPDDLSLFRWYGIVETDRALHSVLVNVSPGSSFDPEAAFTSYKPDPSVALDAARDTASARRFLQIARFPKASIEKTTAGFHIELRPFSGPTGASSAWRIIAVIETDPAGKILSDRLDWDPASRETWFR